MNITKGLIKIGQVVSKHSSEILTAMGVIGLISAGVTAVKNTPKAHENIEKAKEEGEEITVIKAIKLCWKQYICPVILAVLSVACILLARRIDSGRAAALVTACKLSEETAERLETETKEAIGEKGFTKIEDSIAKKDLERNPVNIDDVYNTGTGDSLYFDVYSSKYFRASRDFIDRALTEFKSKLLDYDSLSINDWLECLQIPLLDAMTTGTILGWRVDDVKRQCGGHMPELIFSYHEASNGEPCGWIRMDAHPIVDYS